MKKSAFIIASIIFLLFYTSIVSAVTYNVNCTSCNIPYGDVTPPFETEDTTPTFKFTTSNSIACRIGDTNSTYATMGSSRDCDYGQNTTNHTCTLTTQDALVNYNTSVYINCLNGSDSYINTEKLLMLISGLETPNETEAIQQGIENSIVWPGALVYTNQKIYLRSINNTIVIATVDKVVAYGNQRWIINYANSTEPQLGLFNISPAVYSLEMRNIPIKAIRANVTAFINNTKS